jgi:anti-sigma factor RsiW
MNQHERDNLEFELSQYLDGELSGRRARRMERRLEEEPALREDLKKYAALGEQLDALARTDVPGMDYDWQRSEVVRMLERKRLLDARPRRTIFFRPVFWGAGGALAVAASVVVGIMAWMSSPAGPAKAPGLPAPEISVALVMPAAAAQSQVQAKLRKLDENDYRLAGPPAEEQGMEIATRMKPPPGTVMVSVNSQHRAKASAGSFLFPAEF